MNVDFDAAGVSVKPPSKLAHVVLRTGDMKSMTSWYQTLLGAEVIFENKMLAFLSYDEEHHRIALVEIPGTLPENSTHCGLEHIAFTYNSLAELLLAYRQRKNKGINPIWSVNHGPTTSIYYTDPDGNRIETQVDNFSDPGEANAFMLSKEFNENAIGVDFDPEDLIRRLKTGESEKSLLRRPEIGPRSELPAQMISHKVV